MDTSIRPTVATAGMLAVSIAIMNDAKDER
jgi:hypothetical protein